jgi:hypothetical protein
MIDRRELMLGVTGSLAALPAATPGSDSAWFDPSCWQLFLDDAGIERMEGLRRVVHPPARHPDNPLIRPDTAWERGCQV